MIRIVVTKQGDFVTQVEVKGHAGYAKFGKDIVCSAVSSIACTALMGVVEFSSQKVEYVKEEGYLRFSVPSPQSEEERIRLDAVTKTMLLGLRDIQSGYKAYIKLEE